MLIVYIRFKLHESTIGVYKAKVLLPKTISFFSKTWFFCVLQVIEPKCTA